MFVTKRTKVPLIEFLKDRIYLGAYNYAPQDTATTVHFTIDDALPYNSFHHDFGPLHIGHLYRFAVTLHEVLADEESEGKAVVLYSNTDSRSRANAACILACYMILVQSWPPHLVLAPIAQVEPPLMPFRDAGYAPADFSLTIQDIVYGVWRAKEKKLLDLKTFNLEEYELYERVDQGDFNEIPPHFVAFASPQQKDYNAPLNYPFCQVLDYFESNDVKLVVRLNSELYNKEEFESRGIRHVDLIFEDGTCPSMLFVQAFIGAVECVVADNGKVAVHCKAGLGRTGCLIGAYLIYTYGFTAQEAIGYMRFLRPGMVVGPQQHWLYLHQNEFREWRHTMTLSKISDESLGGFCPLVRIDSPEARGQGDEISDSNDKVASRGTTKLSPPRTPERSILGEADAKSSALPVPTPGQPRKAASPSPAGYSHPQDSTNTYRTAASSRGGAPSSVVKDSSGSSRYGSMRRSADSPVKGSAMGGIADSPTQTNNNTHGFQSTNSDDENDDNANDNDEEYESSLTNPRARGQAGAAGTGAGSELTLARRNISDRLSEKQQQLMGRQLRSASNPGGNFRLAKRNGSYHMTTTTTTTTTMTTLSSSPPTGADKHSGGIGEPLRRSTRISSSTGKPAGVRKVSAARRRP